MNSRRAQAIPVKIEGNSFWLISEQCLHCKLWRSRNGDLKPIRFEQELKQQPQVVVTTYY